MTSSSNDRKAVLWDLDGTLVDSADYHWRSWREAMAAEGREITHEQFLASFGQRNDTILRQWLGPDADDARIERIGDAKEKRYRELIRSSGIAPLPGAAEQYFDAIASAEDVHRGKPDPEVFLVAASRLGVEPARSIVVEDAPAGIEAARRGGMRAELPPDAFCEITA